MDNFNLKKYLAESKLHEEEMDLSYTELTDDEKDDVSDMMDVIYTKINPEGGMKKNTGLFRFIDAWFESKGDSLSEGKLLKEVMDEKMVDYVLAMYDSDVDQEAEEGFQSDVWSKAEYASNAYDESSIFLELIDHLKSVGGKDVVEGNPDIKLELLPNGDIRWSANVTFD